MADLSKLLENYNTLNQKAEQKGIVLFGEEWLSKLPVAELARDFGIDTPVYNRSVKSFRLEDADFLLDSCVCDLNPQKVFIQIGEHYTNTDSFSEKEFTEKYEWMLYTIHAKCNCSIYILSVISDRIGIINSTLKKIAEKYACEYIDLQNCEQPLQVFSKIRFFLRVHPITFSEALKI